MTCRGGKNFQIISSRGLRVGRSCTKGGREAKGVEKRTYQRELGWRRSGFAAERWENSMI